MKNISFLFATLFFSICLLAQTPQKFSYQTVIRNTSNQLLINQLVSIKISVLQGTESGSIVYSERHSPTTNANGLANLSIGSGVVLNGSFSNINWANGPYFIKTETDPNGGNNYTIISTQQLLSVPYALYSGNGISRISSTGDTLYLGNGSSIIIPGLSGANVIGQTQEFNINHQNAQRETGVSTPKLKQTCRWKHHGSTISQCAADSKTLRL